MVWTIPTICFRDATYSGESVRWAWSPTLIVQGSSSCSVWVPGAGGGGGGGSVPGPVISYPPGILQSRRVPPAPTFTDNSTAGGGDRKVARLSGHPVPEAIADGRDGVTGPGDQLFGLQHEVPEVLATDVIELVLGYIQARLKPVVVGLAEDLLELGVGGIRYAVPEDVDDRLDPLQLPPALDRVVLEGSSEAAGTERDHEHVRAGADLGQRVDVGAHAGVVGKDAAIDQRVIVRRRVGGDLVRREGGRRHRGRPRHIAHEVVVALWVRDRPYAAEEEGLAAFGLVGGHRDARHRVLQARVGEVMRERFLESGLLVLGQDEFLLLREEGLVEDRAPLVQVEVDEVGRGMPRRSVGPRAGQAEGEDASGRGAGDDV